MKKEWFEPKIVDISVKITENGRCKRDGVGDGLASDALNPWQDPCCPDCS